MQAYNMPGRGWIVEETVTHGEDRWAVTTMKRSDRKIRCKAVKLDPPDPALPGMDRYSASSPQHTLFENSAKATEKAVRDAHTVGVRKLKEILDNESNGTPSTETD